MRTITWDNEKQVMKMIDQRILPHEFKIQNYETYQGVAEAIQTMVVRGAPAIGVAAAYGMALAALQSEAETREALLADLETAGEVFEPGSTDCREPDMGGPADAESCTGCGWR